MWNPLRISLLIILLCCLGCQTQPHTAAPVPTPTSTSAASVSEPTPTQAKSPTPAPNSASASSPKTPVARAYRPRVIAYYNANTSPILKAADIYPYTHYILSFLVPDGRGGVTPSAALKPVLADTTSLQKLQAAGKIVMVSVGGGAVGGQDWLNFGRHAEAAAESIAQIVERYNLDGVDLDVEAIPFERQSAFQPYADAVIALTNRLARRLPGKFLTHAPQPPYLCRPGSSSECPRDSLYATILAATGNRISWLNMQYYSNPPLTSSDIDELNHYTSIVQGWNGFPGLEPSRLVLGKPYSSRVSGYAPRPDVIANILQPLMTTYGNAFGGFMAWEFSEDPDGVWATAISQTLNP